MFGLSFPTKFPMMCVGKPVLCFCTHVDVFNLLSTHLNLSHNGIKMLDTLGKNASLAKIPKHQIIQNCKILQNMGVNVEEVEFLACCLSLQPIIVKNRIAILKEMGVKSINLKDICRFSTAMNKSLKSFKIMYNIPANEDIMQNMLQCVNIKVDKDYKSLMKVRDTIRAGDFYQVCMLYYKTIYQNLHDPLFYKNRKLKYQSFTEVFKLIKVLKTKCNFDDEFLKRHPYLLNLDSDHVEEFLRELKDFNENGNDIYDFVRKFPRALFAQAKKVKELLQLYNVLGIPSQALCYYALMFKMEKEIFLRRYMNIGNSFELSTWLQHRRILSLIYKYNAVINRVNHLKLMNNVYKANINTFLSRKSFFLRYLEGDLYMITVKRYLIYILRKELGEDKVDLIHCITKHPHWKHCSVIHVDRMLRSLKKYFSEDDICKNIHIILYPRFRVVNVLNSLRREYTPENGYTFTHSQYLALCLYKLEKTYHFSGDAVWQTTQAGISKYNLNIFRGISQNESERLLEYMHTKNKMVFNVSDMAWLEYLLQ